MRLTKRHYLGLLLFLFLGTTVVTWPMGLFALALAQVEVQKALGTKGYVPPKLADSAHNKNGTYTGGFGDLTLHPFGRGQSAQLARSALQDDGFEPKDLDNQDLKLTGRVETYTANWTDGVCSHSLRVMISSDQSDKILVSKISEVAWGCL